ncbi:uncharacterized protein LOC131690095 [Topomyia yanbarensis]|uniref:uncharacterized protein LOC131690095 n=1 Tax=Topomyia yanbarensis TaxID=2498891 RepID=UPI00273BBAA7|nr:uncharacterized protein LOC131690095 [Topomyia yanbarensis]XP_058831613.1 uncharacterized protein LOC131690095 [Topomyia yanbarensis]
MHSTHCWFRSHSAEKSILGLLISITHPMGYLEPVSNCKFRKACRAQFSKPIYVLALHYMAQNINPSSYYPNCVNLPHASDSTVFFDTSMKAEIRGIPDHIRAQVIPSIFHSKFREVECNKMFYTDGSSLDGFTGFGIFIQNLTSSFKLNDPASVYVAELAAIQYILGINDTLPTDHYFIVSDSLSSIEAFRSMKPRKHILYFLRKIWERLRALSVRSYKITLVWVPSNCSIPGNEEADSLAKALQGNIYKRPISFSEFFSITPPRTLESWKTSWSNGELGKWPHSIIPKVSTLVQGDGCGSGFHLRDVSAHVQSPHAGRSSPAYWARG